MIIMKYNKIFNQINLMRLIIQMNNIKPIMIKWIVNQLIVNQNNNI